VLPAILKPVLHRNAKTDLWRSTSEVAYSVANSVSSARQAATAIRGHWHIENTLHYSRDVTFREDHSRIRHNPGVFARLRSFAYNISMHCSSCASVESVEQPCVHPDHLHHDAPLHPTLGPPISPTVVPPGTGRFLAVHKS